MIATSQFAPPSPRLTGMRLAVRVGVRVIAGDDDVGDQPLQLAVGARLVDRGQALVELVHRQPALAGGLAEDFGVVFAVGV